MKLEEGIWENILEELVESGYYKYTLYTFMSLSKKKIYWEKKREMVSQEFKTLAALSENPNSRVPCAHV